MTRRNEFLENPRRPDAGFTLVELLIVVIILGILAAIVIPKTGDLTKTAAQSQFAHDLRILTDAATLYEAKTGDYPVDGSSGTIPAGFETYVKANTYEKATPIGGVWDTEKNSFGYAAAVGVHFLNGPAKDDAYMTEIDELFDNGDLSTGSFRKLDSDRYYIILAQ